MCVRERWSHANGAGGVHAANRSALPITSILVVDAVVLIGVGLSHHLALLDYETDTITSAEDAVEGLRSGKFDPQVVITDMRLSGANDGLWLMQWLADHKPDIHLIGTATDGLNGLSATQLCGRAVFQKPYRLTDISDRIAEVMRV